jgi:hypothetical protein
MPVIHRWDGALLRMNLVGTYEPEDILRQFEAALVEAPTQDKVALLVDTTKSEVLGTRTPGQIRLVAQALAPYAERIGGRCAIVATEDIHFGLSRMGSVYSESVGVETEVFRNQDEALAWLGVRADRVPEMNGPIPESAP